MQFALLVFFALLLAHLLGDFPFQSEWITRNKGRRPGPTLLHIAIHCGTAWVCLLAFPHLPFLSITNQLIVVCYMLLHLAIDAIKNFLIRRKPSRDTGWLFLADQLAHGITLVIAASLLARVHIAQLLNATQIAPARRLHILAAVTIYAGVIFWGGYLIRYFTRDLARGITTEPEADLKNAGLYIGWIERFLVVTAIAVQSPALVGLILTGKSIARFPELKQARFAEYFLIGTLLSTSIAIIGGLAIVRMCYGTFSLK